MPLTTNQKDSLRTNLAATLALDSAKFQLSFQSGSVVMTVTFLDGSTSTRTPLDEASGLSALSMSYLSTALGETVSSVGNPTLISNVPTSPPSSSDDGDSSASGDSGNAGIIAGAVVGGLAGVAAVGLIYYFFCKRESGAKTEVVVVRAAP